ncbi:hypothetical protein BH24BAC1_BH24BAC1_10230 [soil metagenome]
MNHDSAMVVIGDGHCLLNLNDARLFPMQLRDIRQKAGGRIDILTFQGAGASWYPMCYGYTAEKAQAVSRQKKLSKFAYCLKSMKIVEPIIGLPIAGPPAFLDATLFGHNAEMEGGIFPDQQQVADWLATKGIQNTTVLLPGDSWDTEEQAKLADPEWEDFSFENRWSYLREYQTSREKELKAVIQRHPEPQESLREPFEKFFRHLLALSPYFNKRIDMRVGFDITGPGGGQWFVDFRPGREAIGEGLEDCGYRYTFESRWLPSLLDGSTPWEDFFLSFRFQARRDPDLYNDHLLGLLKFAEAEALAEVERFETAANSEERITVQSDGITYSISRYCPHAGNDLLTRPTLTARKRSTFLRFLLPAVDQL